MNDEPYFAALGDRSEIVYVFTANGATLWRHIQSIQVFCSDAEFTTTTPPFIGLDEFTSGEQTIMVDNTNANRTGCDGLGLALSGTKQGTAGNLGTCVGNYDYSIRAV